jgi:hypothetical protein
MSATKVISSADSFFAGVDYEPLLAAWPETSIDKQLLTDAPAEARYILKKAYSAYKSGYSEDEDVWADWLALFEEVGQQNEGVQVSLLGLLFSRHEARHHLDFYSTPLGWFFPSLLAGYYSRLRQLVHTRDGTPEENDITRRLDRFLRVQNLIVGNVPRLEKKLWSDVPLIERKMKLGIFRFRGDRIDPGLAIATVEPAGGTERALSVNSILEVRAVIETSGYMAGRLRAAEANDNQVVAAVKLLLSLCIQIARDDYWVLLNVGLPAVDLDEAAKLLAARGPRCARLLLATWFGLHMELPAKDVEVPAHPPFRSLLALNELFKFSDEELTRPNIDWNDVLEQLSKKIGARPLPATGASHKQSLEALEQSLKNGSQFTGLAREHLLYLSNVARVGMALRGQSLNWLDNVGWPKYEDPLLVVNWAKPPANITTAWSRLTRVRNQLRTGAHCSAAKEIANSLF